MAEQIDLTKIYVPSDKIIARQIEDNIILVPFEVGTGTVGFDESLYSLEGTGKEIWEKLSEKLSVKSLCDQLSDNYDESVDIIVKDVIELLSDLFARGLIVESE